MKTHLLLVSAVMILSSFSAVARDDSRCSSLCVALDSRGEILDTHSISARGQSERKAWGLLKRKCQALFHGYGTELMVLESTGSEHHHRRTYRWWRYETHDHSWVSFKKDAPNAQSCSPVDEDVYDGDLPVLG